jgi:hypothetical protein
MKNVGVISGSAADNVVVWLSVCYLDFKFWTHLRYIETYSGLSLSFVRGRYVFESLPDELLS